MMHSRLRRLISWMPGALVGLLVTPGVALAEWGLNFPKPVSPIAQEQYDLHMLITWIVTVIFIIVFGIMFYSIINHRKSKGAKAAQFSHSTKAEVIWTVIPTLILLGMAIPSTKALIMMEDTTESNMTIKVSGFQWGWHYEYLDHGIEFYSKLSTPRAQIKGEAPKGEHYLLEVDKHMALPVGQKVRFLITSHDVIHAWWVPQLGGKKDGFPGFINEFWIKPTEVGTYRGQCSELCGKDHGFMPIVVDTMEQVDFDAWVAKQKSVSASQG